MTKIKPPHHVPASPLSEPSPLVSNVQPLRPNAAHAHTFDPSATLIRIPELLALTGMRRATVYKRLKDDPTFPRPVPLSDSTARGAPVGFVLAEVEAYVRARIAKRGAA